MYMQGTVLGSRNVLPHRADEVPVPHSEGGNVANWNKNRLLYASISSSVNWDNGSTSLTSVVVVIKCINMCKVLRTEPGYMDTL